MDRQIIYPGQLLSETSLLQMTKDAMIGAAKLASAILGTGTVASGFAVTPTGPASLQVLCAPGEIYSMAAIDALAFSTLPADTVHSILKQGILLDGVTLSCPAPITTAQSINYLVQVAYQDADSTPVLLPYYNSTNPSLPYSGMGNNGLTQNTARKGVAIVSVKAGVSAATGTQVTPAPDAGNIGLYAVTVAFGQTTIVAGNIAVLATAPLINSTLHGLSPAFSVPLAIAPATQSQHALTLDQVQQSYAWNHGFQAISTSGNFTVPAGVYWLEIEGWGGGGAGGGTGTASQTSGGGGAGGYFRLIMAVTPGQVISATIGAGGVASPGTAGGNGGTTSFGGGSATGGLGGQPNPTGSGGAGGTASGGILNTSGATGGAGISTTTGGSGGGAPFGGAGGLGGIAGPGSAAGPGAGGGGRGGGTTGAGGPGMPGQINVSW